MTIPAGASEVTNRDVPSTVQGLPERETDVVRIIGVTEWGPLGLATVCTDFDEWRRIFGGYLASYYTALEVEQMFAGGVREVVTVRTVHYSGSTPVTAAKASNTLQTGATAATKGSVTGSVIGPWALVAGDTLIGKVDGLAEQTATITATAALRENTPAEPYALSDSQTLTVKVDRGAVQTIVFLTGEFVAIATATAEEVAAVINAKITGALATVTSGGTKVTITSDRKGSGSYIEVTGGTANTALSFNVAEVAGTGNVSNVASVTYLELETILETAWSNGGGVAVTSSSGYLKIEANTAGIAGSVQVVSTSTADDEIGLDNAVHAGFDGTAADTLKIYGKYEGAKGNGISISIAAASGGDASRFNLTVWVDGLAKEPYQDLTMDTADDLYVEDVINTLPGASSWVTAEDKTATGTPTQRRPATTVTNAVLTGGNDGLTDIAYSDFVGDEGYNTGLYAFDTRPDEGDILVCPDCVVEGFQDAATSVCQDHWHMMCVFVPDIAAGLSYIDAATAADAVTASEARLAHCWPRVKIPNPDKAIYGVSELLLVPSSGLYVARMATNTRRYANTTAEWTQPGNQIYGLLQNAVGIETETVFKPNVRAYLAAHLINPIVAGRTEAGSYGVWVNDVLPGSKTGIWRSVGATRGVARLRKQVAAYMELQRTQPNTEEARWLDKFRIEAHLVGLTGRGVFATTDASAAFYVNTDPEGTGINNPLEQKAQKYHVIVGLAIAEPKRFIDVGFTRDDRGVESYIQKQLAM